MTWLKLEIVILVFLRDIFLTIKVVVKYIIMVKIKMIVMKIIGFL